MTSGYLLASRADLNAHIRHWFCSFLSYFRLLLCEQLTQVRVNDFSRLSGRRCIGCYIAEAWHGDRKNANPMHRRLPCCDCALRGLLRIALRSEEPLMIRDIRDQADRGWHHNPVCK
jgi:hypothetical protein